MKLYKVTTRAGKFVMVAPLNVVVRIYNLSSPKGRLLPTPDDKPLITLSGMLIERYKGTIE